MACVVVGGYAQASFTQYVNPRVGTGGHGHVFLGANVPFGYVQLGPTEHTRGWDWCSGYHDSDSVLIGFGHQHLSGTGIGELGDVAFLPVADARQKEIIFHHASENVRPSCSNRMCGWNLLPRSVLASIAIPSERMHRRRS